MKLVFHVKVFSNSTDLHEIESEWNDFIITHSDNPFLLLSYVKEFINIDFMKGWFPLIFVAFEGKKIVGVAPFAVKMRFNVLFAKFLFKLHFSPDFIVHDAYRELFVERVVRFLFYDLGCQLADLNLTLPTKFQSVEVLKRICEANKIYFRTQLIPEYGHCVLPVTISWSSFEELRGSNFRKRLKRIERKMKEAGGYETVCADRVQERVFQDIIYIDGKSWKEEWRKRKRIESDTELFAIWKGTVNLKNEIPDFKWKIWFLKINNILASYAFTFQFKNVGYIAKTSFNNEFRSFYPGIYVVNVAIKDFFESGKVEKVDFQTNLSFMRTWDPLVYPRIRIMMGKGSLFSFMVFLSTNESFCRVRDKISSSFFDILPFAAVEQ